MDSSGVQLISVFSAGRYVAQRARPARSRRSRPARLILAAVLAIAAHLAAIAQEPPVDALRAPRALAPDVVSSSEPNLLAAPAAAPIVAPAGDSAGTLVPFSAAAPGGSGYSAAYSPADSAAEAPGDVPVDVPGDTPVDAPVDALGDAAGDLPHDSLDDVLRRLDRLEASLAPAADLPAVAPQDGDDGWIDLSSEKWNVRLGGHVQADYVLWADRDPAITSPLARNYFEFRRLRLVADGTGYGVYDFRLQMTLEPESTESPTQVAPDGTPNVTPDVKDAYFSINEVPWLGRVRIGNFFVPFSLEQVTNDTNNMFLERSIPTQGVFAVDREVGIAMYNCREDQNLSWTCGIFIDNISDSFKERIDNNQGYRLSGRVVWLPYYDEPSNGRYLLHTGLGVLHTSDHDDQVRFRARPQIHEGPRLIDSGVVAASNYTTGNVELAAVMGPLTLQSEMFASSVDRLDDGRATLYGAYVHGSFFLTGENRIYERFGQHGAQFGRNQPFNNVFWVPGCHGLGAWELKARWSYFDMGELDAGQYNDLTVGFNWYWSDRVRGMFDWIHPVTSTQTCWGPTRSDIIGMRFDWNW